MIFFFNFIFETRALLSLFSDNWTKDGPLRRRKRLTERPRRPKTNERTNERTTGRTDGRTDQENADGNSLVVRVCVLYGIFRLSHFVGISFISASQWKPFYSPSRGRQTKNRKRRNEDWSEKFDRILLLEERRMASYLIYDLKFV